MNLAELLSFATGLGLLAGVRLYSVSLALGVGLRLGWIDLDPQYSALDILASWPLLGLSAFGFVVELAADKIPWVDSAWDALHTFIRPIGASLLAVTAAGDVSPGVQLAVIMLSGGAATLSHSAKAATRLVVNQSPEPASNVALSLLGDVAAPIGLWLTLSHPMVMAGAAAVFFAIFLFAAPFVFRVLRLQTLGLLRLVRSFFVATEDEPETDDLEARLRSAGEPVEDEILEKIRELRPGVRSVVSVRAAATAGLGGLRHAVGRLCLADEELIFVGSRWFRLRAEPIALDGGARSSLSRGLLFNRLTIRSDGRDLRFLVFKDAPAGGATLASVLDTA